MTSTNVSPANHIPHDHAWQTLIEFTLPGEPGSEYLASERVAEAVQSLNWPAAHLARLKLALVKASRNALDRSHISDSKTSLHIRVLIPKGGEATPDSSQAASEPTQSQVPEGVAQQTGWSLSRGWGFFLVQKQENRRPGSVGELHDVIELFLYQETHRSSHQ